MGRNRYPAELVEELVAQVLEGQSSLTRIAQKQGIHPGVLSKWVKKHRPAPGTSPQPPLSPDEELDHLRKRLYTLEERVETLRSVLEKHFVHKYSQEKSRLPKEAAP